MTSKEYKVSKKGLDFLIKEEGSINYEYYCPSNVETIGVGCVTKYLSDETISKFKKVPLEKVNIIENIKPVVRDGLVMIATDSQVTNLLINRLKDFEIAINKLVTIKLKQYEFDAMLSFCFNIGVANFTRSTLLKKVNNQVSGTEIQKWFYVWNKAGGKVLPGLVKRREKEAKLFLEGIYYG